MLVLGRVCCRDRRFACGSQTRQYCLAVWAAAMALLLDLCDSRRAPALDASGRLPAVLPSCTHELLPYRPPRLSHAILLFRPSCFNLPSFCTPGCSDAQTLTRVRAYAASRRGGSYTIRRSSHPTSSFVTARACRTTPCSFSAEHFPPRCVACLCDIAYRVVHPCELQGLKPSCLCYLSTRN